MSAAQALAPDAALDDFLERAVRLLSSDPPCVGDPTSNPRGDHDLDPDPLTSVPPPPHRAAAVLVPVVARSGSLFVILTQRAAHLRDHSGQVALPGGKIDPDDATPVEAALREAEEEIGLRRDAVRVLGYLDPYLSATGFLVVPVIGLVDPEAALVPNPSEVAGIFEVPLSFLMDGSRYALNALVWQGRNRHYYALTFAGRTIWGVTAGILNNLRERLFAS